MKTKFTFIFFLAGGLSTLQACSCRGVGDYLDFYRDASDLFVGKVVAVSQWDKYHKYELAVEDPLRGEFGKTEYVYIGKFGTCPLLTLRVGETYLLQVSRGKGMLYSGYCHYVSAHDRLREDTALIKAFDRKDAYVKSRFFEGQVKNGKRTGRWILYDEYNSTEVIEQGDFVDDRKEGLWKYGRDSAYYKAGEWLHTDYTYTMKDVRVRIIDAPEGTKMYYPTGKLWKYKSDRDYFVYYPDGHIEQQARLRQGIAKTWKKYDLEGKLQKELHWKYPDGPDVRDYFYLTEDPESGDEPDSTPPAVGK